MSKETLNEEQPKDATRDARTGFDYTVFAVSPKLENNSASKITFVESERFIDARAFACRLLGVSEVVIAKHESETKPVPRWQVRMFGHATNGNTIRMQSRERLTNAPGNEPQWRDTREM